MLSFRSKDRLFYQTLIDVTYNIVEAAQLFRENVETLQEKERYAERIKELESKGDDYTHLLIQELNQTFVTPMDREDIYELAAKLDDVMDGLEACAARFCYYHVEQTTPILVRFAELIEKSAQFVQEAFVALEKKDFGTVRKCSIEINAIEDEADSLVRDSISQLFANVKDPIELFKMKEIYETLEKVTDTFEDLTDVLESVVMKYV